MPLLFCDLLADVLAMDQKKPPVNGIPRLRCALVGTGRIGSSLELDSKREKPASHAGAISAHPDCVLAGGCDANPQALVDFGRQWDLPDSTLFEDPRRMLEELRPDILHIATHPDSHMELLLLAARQAVPVVVLEKPVADKLGRAKKALKQLAALAKVQKTAGTPATRVIVNHERRFSRDYLFVKDFLDSGELGPLLSVQGRIYMGKTKASLKVLHHDGTHMVDIIRFLTGKTLLPRQVLGHWASAESNAVVHFAALEPGSPLPGPIRWVKPVFEGSLDISAGRDYLHFELDLFLERGRIRIGNGLLEILESQSSPYYEQFRSLMPRYLPDLGPTGYFANMMDHAVELCRNPGIASRSSLEDGIAALEFIERTRTLYHWRQGW